MLCKHIQRILSCKHIQRILLCKHIQRILSCKHIQTILSCKHIQRIFLCMHIQCEVVWIWNGVKDEITEYQNQKFCWTGYIARFYKQQMTPYSCWVLSIRLEMITSKTITMIERWNCPVIWANIDKKDEIKNKMEVYCSQCCGKHLTT